MPSTSVWRLEFHIFNHNSSIFGYTPRAFHWTNRKPLGGFTSNLQLTFTLSSSASDTCVAANADVSVAGSIVVTAARIDTFLTDVSCGTNWDVVTDATFVQTLRWWLTVRAVSSKRPKIGVWVTHCLCCCSVISVEIRTSLASGNGTLGNFLSRVITVGIGWKLLTPAVLPLWVFATEQVFKDLSVRKVSNDMPRLVLRFTDPMERSS